MWKKIAILSCLLPIFSYGQQGNQSQIINQDILGSKISSNIIWNRNNNTVNSMSLGIKSKDIEMSYSDIKTKEHLTVSSNNVSLSITPRYNNAKFGNNEKYLSYSYGKNYSDVSMGYANGDGISFSYREMISGLSRTKIADFKSKNILFYQKNTPTSDVVQLSLVHNDIVASYKEHNINNAHSSEYEIKNKKGDGAKIITRNNKSYSVDVFAKNMRFTESNDTLINIRQLQSKDFKLSHFEYLNNNQSRMELIIPGVISLGICNGSIDYNISYPISSRSKIHAVRWCDWRTGKESSDIIMMTLDNKIMVANNYLTDKIEFSLKLKNISMSLSNDYIGMDMSSKIASSGLRFNTKTPDKICYYVVLNYGSLSLNIVSSYLEKQKNAASLRYSVKF